MDNLPVFSKGSQFQIISAMRPETIDKVRALETANAELPQVDIETVHTFHAGVYARTIRIPAGVLLTGALIKIPTLVIVSGNVIIYTDEGSKRLDGYNVFQAEAGRKQAFLAESDTFITMSFATSAETVEEAEEEFTDETDLLMTNKVGK